MQKKLKKGFTLIELLVVIAIIALLLAILMPSLKKAKEKAKQTVCKSNLKGIGLAIKLYLDDYNNRTYTKHTMAGPSGRPGNGYRWFDTATGDELDPGDSDTYWGLAYKDYTKNPKIFNCPSFGSMKSTIYPIREGDILGGFAFNRFLNETKATAVRSPSEFIVAQDHVEPGPEPMDLFHIENTSLGYNLEHYRDLSNPIDRAKEYRAIFRHSKKNTAMDNSPGDIARIQNINDNPNGQSDTLRLDGSVDGMYETNGKNVRKSWYTGK